jgi:hypothetical protein
MRKIGFLVACLSVMLFVSSTASAGIVGWNCGADGDGAIETVGDLAWDDTLPAEEGISAYELRMDAQQFSGPAHMEGDFTVEGDPIVYLMEDVDNQTDFTWTAYDFKVFMTQPFTITTAFAPFGWDYTISPISGPGVVFPHDSGTGYLIDVLFTSTDSQYDIDPTEVGTFGVRMQFDGSVAFCTEQTPIPEPATLAMLGLGALGLLRRKK